MFNFHSYTESIKRTLDTAPTQSGTDPMTPAFASPRDRSFVPSGVLSKKGLLWIFGVIIIGISVVAFLTQLVLLAVSNVRGDTVKNMNDTASMAATTSAVDIYVRSDAAFGVTDVSRIDLGIPGVSQIGTDSGTPNSFLTDNINKYADTTLVVGGRNQNGQLIGSDDSDDLSMQGRYSILPKITAPMLSSKAYLVADLETGEVILEKDSEVAHPLASVSKLMTALVAREKMDMQTIAVVSRDATSAYGGQGNLGSGEKIRLADLLFPLLMESSNDAAEVFADQYGHSKFMEEMNKKAIEINMLDTYYGDPSGLDPRNTSTPSDLLKLARYIYKHDPQIYDMTRVKQFSIKGHTWYNKNALLLTQGFAGGKNGFIDQAKQTTVSLFDVQMAKGGVRTVVVIALKSDNKNGDVAKLLNYLKKAAVYEVK